MIPYVEIKDADRVTIGIIDTAKSIIWHSVYFGVGDFEIYAQATPQNIELLRLGYYVLRPDSQEVGVIEDINVGFNVHDGYIITATGRFAKCILDRRLIYNLNGTVNTATILRGNVEIAVRQVVKDNAIDCTFDTRRNIPIFGLAALNNYPYIIRDKSGNAAQKQVSYDNLMTYTDSVLAEYGMAARVIYNDSNKKLLYSVYCGVDRSESNTDGNDPVIFSVDYDNLNSSTYDINVANARNTALIGGAGEGIERFYSFITDDSDGLERRELFVDARSVNRTYDDGGTQEEYTDDEYAGMLNQQGMAELDKHPIQEAFSGSINATFGAWKINEDYFLGDIVTVQDNKLGKYNTTRIIETTEVQDESGYTVDVVFGS